MVKRIAIVLVVAGLGATGLLADFSYEQTSRLTGGMMASVMKVTGVFSKQAREPIQTTTLIKGNRMAQLSARSGHIIDLDRETITEIDFQKRTYSVVTFAQMAEALKQLEAKMKAEKSRGATDISIKASVNNTGQSKPIAGLTARETIMTVEMEGTDSKTGERGIFMVMTADMWMAEPAGYDEVHLFYRRMADKLSWMPGAGAFAQGRSEITRGMAELQKEANKLSGVPVYQVTKMGFPKGEEPPGQPPAEQPQAEAQEKPSAGGALGRLGGRLGGLGGLGRRKKTEPQPAAQPAPPAEAGAQAGGTSRSLMEVTTEATGFSNAPVDPAKFEVPAGFKQVESEMLKATRR